MAGIAAGRNGAAVPVGLQGVAPDAGILPVQVFSFDPNGVQAPVGFGVDLAQAFAVAAAQLTAGLVHQPFVINMSLGGNFHTLPCSTGAFAAYANAVQALRTAGVPVIVATGNARASGNAGIAFPACLPGAIKVSATNNDGVGNTPATYAQVVNPGSFPGETFWLAPGGGGGTTVTSSVVGGTYGSVNWAGTSMAAPHIAGLYAAYKAAVPGAAAAAVVADASAWFVANTSVNVLVNVAPVGAVVQNVNWQRVRLPNF